MVDFPANAHRHIALICPLSASSWSDDGELSGRMIKNGCTGDTPESDTESTGDRRPDPSDLKCHLDEDRGASPSWLSRRVIDAPLAWHTRAVVAVGRDRESTRDAMRELLEAQRRTPLGRCLPIRCMCVTVACWQKRSEGHSHSQAILYPTRMP